MSTLTLTTDVSLFLTDYASYNDGSQFEFGHWVNLNDFDDADEFLDYVREHFAKCDLENPLDSPREEMMITDCENLPDGLYSECMSHSDLEKIFEYMEIASELEDIDTDKWIELHNQYQSLTDGDDYIYKNDEYFFEERFSNNPMEAIRVTYFGDYNYSDEYLTYGNSVLESHSKSRIMDEIDTDEILKHIIANKEDYKL